VIHTFAVSASSSTIQFEPPRLQTVGREPNRIGVIRIDDRDRVRPCVSITAPLRWIIKTPLRTRLAARTFA